MFVVYPDADNVAPKKCSSIEEAVEFINSMRCDYVLEAIK